MRAPDAPHSRSPVELKEVLEAERAGAPFLLLRDGDGRQRLIALELAGEEALGIGRDERNAVALDWDRRVSRSHAVLEPVGEGWSVVDDGRSRNGTFVNGTRVSGRRRLRDGDTIRCGDTLLVYRAPAEGASRMTVAGDDLPADVELTAAQRRVLVALCRPYRDGGPFATPASNAQIAAELVLSVEAVKTHLRTLFDKLAVEDLPASRKRVRLAERALMAGLVTERDLAGD